MKKLNYLFIMCFIVFGLSLFSCTGDDSDETETETETEDTEQILVGEWQLTNYSVSNGEATLVILDQETTATFTQEGENYDYTLEISEDNGTIIENGSYDVITEYFIELLNTTETNTSTITADNEIFADAWVLTDDETLTITVDGTALALTIEDISDTELQLSIDASTIVDDEILSGLALDFEITVTQGTANLTFSKN